MTIQLVKNSLFDLQTYVGDSGILTIGNIPTNMPNYVLYFEARGKKTVIKTKELHGASETDIDITVQDTKDLGVGRWPYGVKLCTGDTEDTYIPDQRIAPEAYIIVRKEVVEGTINAEANNE